uniref:DENN domain-containing protein 2D-like n=1 Tax=Gadus morhua TaxID=8049 RepID=A0A8C5CB82_GADMO
MSEDVKRRAPKEHTTDPHSRLSVQPKMQLMDHGDGSHSSHDEPAAERSGMKRLSTLWSSFRRGNKDRLKDVPESPVEPGPAEPLEREPRVIRGQYFFEYLVVVSLVKSGGGYEPQISYQFPKRDGMGRSQKEEEEKILKAITLFCFPEGIDWAPMTEYQSETFSFVLTEVDGSRKNGYCRRLLIFDEVEKRRQKSMAMIYPFMQKLRESPFPAPGNSVEIKSHIPESGTEIIKLTRPLDSWLEHVNFATLCGCLSNQEILLVFAAAVLERRIVFIAEELGTLSQVAHAVSALLYPFTWQHTLISIVPSILIDVVMAPTPYLLGVQKKMVDLIDDKCDMLLVDLSENRTETFIASIGDEGSILPPKLHDEILLALENKKEKATVEEWNRVVSEAFLGFFVKTVGHYASYLTSSGGAEARRTFQSRAFYKSIKSNTTRHFVKKFMQTQMFDIFIQEAEQRQSGTHQGIFHQKIQEYQNNGKAEKKKR